MKFFYRLFFILIFIVFLLYGTARILPAPSIGLNHSLELYDDKGNLFYASSNDHYGSYISLNKVSTNFTNAILAIEDQNFYHHSGFDIWGICRAFLTNLIHGEIRQGASTISQQYAKNLFLNNDQTWKRKIKEAWLTIRIEVHYTKEEIMEGYVNTLYFGDGIYGIENAAKYFFNKEAKDLSILEGSLLAGMINGPELYSPYRNYPLTQQRQQLVLKAMKEEHYITQEQYEKLCNQPTPLHSHTTSSNLSTKGYFRQYIYQELEALGYDNFDGKMKIYTTIDTALQEEITLQTSNIIQDDLQMANVILEPNSGAIKVLIGGKNYQTSQFNRATQAKRQMASTIKPLLYYEALRNGFHPLTKFISEKTTFYLEDNQTYSPKNYNNLYPNKEITLLEAIASSDNIYAVKTHLFLGETTLASCLSSLSDKAVASNPSLALGTQELTPLQLATIYNCIASKGIYYEPYCIESISINDKEVYCHTVKGQRKLEETYCLILSQLLRAPFYPSLNGTMKNYVPDTLFAAKTGTSDWDSWLVAYNPSQTLVFWAGYDDNQYLNYENQTKMRELFLAVFKEKTTNSWYQPNHNIISLPINLETCEIDEQGVPFWFYQNTQKHNN